MRKNKKASGWLLHLFAVVVFLGLAVVFFMPFLMGEASFLWDTREFGFMNLHMISRAFAEGGLPLWNEMNFSGYPFAGDVETMMFYPGTWIFVAIFGVVQFSQLVWFFVAHYFLGLVGAYALGYKLSKNVFAAAVGAVAFAFSGYALGHISHMGQDFAYMWMPLGFLAYVVALERKKLFFSLLAGLVFGVLILIGHFNTCVYMVLGLVILSLMEFVRAKKWDRLRVFLHAFGATVFALLIAAMLVFPVLELVQQSNRTHLTYEQQSEDWSLNPLILAGAAYPNVNHILQEDAEDTFNGGVDITQGYFYIGLIPLFFMFVGLFSRNKYKWFFIVLGAVALLAAFGKYTPVNKILFYGFPGFNKARMAVQIMGMAFFGGAGMVVLGAQKVGEVFEKSRLKKLGAIFAVAVLVIIVLDIFHAGMDRRFYSEKISPDVVFDENGEAEFVASLKEMETEPFRILDVSEDYLKNIWEYYEVENVWGNGGIKLKKYNDLFAKTDRYISEPISERLLDFLNVKYVVEEYGEFLVNEEALPRAYFVDDYVIEVDEEMQLAMMVEDRVDFANEVLLDQDPEYLGEEETSRLVAQRPSGVVKEKDDVVEFVVREDDYLKLEVSNNSDAILVLSEVDYDGWRLFVDGVEGEYLTANYVFRAVPLKGGAHVVEFVYRPQSVYVGVGVTMLAFMSFIVVAIRQFLKRKK